MRLTSVSAAVCALALTGALPAFAQRFPFEKTFDASSPATLDVSTIRGKIEIAAGDPGKIVVSGGVTVRVGLSIPADAVAIAQRIAGAPPIERDGATIRLRPPADPAERRAVTVNYIVRVPPDTTVRTVSESGATTVRGVAGALDVRTQSAAIEIDSAGGATIVTSGSGSIRVVRAGSSLRVRTQSGKVDATLTGQGDVDVRTGSSAITLHGVRGGLMVDTQSGRVTLGGRPGHDWTVTTGSSAVTVEVESGAAFSVDARSRSGSVAVDGPLQGSTDKRMVSGKINGGGPTVRITTGSGAIRLRGPSGRQPLTVLFLLLTE